MGGGGGFATLLYMHDYYKARWIPLSFTIGGNRAINSWNADPQRAPIHDDANQITGE